jgi:hypothetical protein
MSCHEVSTGNCTSRVENTDDGIGGYDRGVILGYAAARRGQKINSTIYKLDHDLRGGYLDGYADYQYEATRYHRLDYGRDA